METDVFGQYDWQTEDRERNYDHFLLCNAVKQGTITKPLFCSNCHQKKRIIGHHEDYKKPLQVIWLCHLCHKRLYLKKKNYYERKFKKIKALKLIEKNQMSEYLSIKDLTKMLTVDPQWVKKRIKSKEIPHYKLGRRIIMKRTEIDEWLNKHKKGEQYD